MGQLFGLASLKISSEAVKLGHLYPRDCEVWVWTSSSGEWGAERMSSILRYLQGSQFKNWWYTWQIHWLEISSKISLNNFK